MQKETQPPFYDSAQRQNIWLREMIETFKYKDLIFHLVRRDITARYKRSILGIAWTMINPLGMMLILSLVFSQVFHAVEGYPAYILSGLLMWNFFSQSTVNGIGSIVWGGDLFRRIYVPRSIFAISAIGTAIVNLLISLVPFLIVSIVIGRYPTINFFAVVIPIILLSFFSLGLSLIIASVGVRFPDIVEVYNNILLLAWMYLTPIIYPLEVLPDWLLSLEKFNPMFHFIRLFRDPLYYNEPLYLQLVGICTLMALISFTSGWIIFSRMTDEIAYRS
ncbi:MAG: ABC transporter [Chloroflexi bacterium HGW-Chloroflexi-6]|nr:MAG: ABC transporter [Chloroflexi bacterium HGW-Chloroflexi-6]